MFRPRRDFSVFLHVSAVVVGFGSAFSESVMLADLAPTYQRWGRAEGFVGAFMGILLIAAIFFMTTKPGLG